MQILGLLMPLLGLAAFITYVWMVVLAFKRSAVWGILVLLLSPFAMIVFAVKHWEESKKPFLIHIGSSLASIVVLFDMFAAMGGAMIAAANQMEAEMGQAEFADLVEPATGGLGPSSDFGRIGGSEPAPKREVIRERGDAERRSEVTRSHDRPTRVAETGSVRLAAPLEAYDELPADGVADTDGLTITFGEARRHVGELVHLVDHRGLGYTGRLTQADAGSLVLEKNMSAGTFTVRFRQPEIRTLRLVIR